MSHPKTKWSVFILSGLLLATVFTTPGNCSKCCLTQMINVDSLTAIMADSTVTNLVVSSKTCDKISFSAVYMGIMTVTEIYTSLENNAVETRMITSGLGQKDTVIDTTQDACNAAVKNFFKVPSMGLLGCYPNPFHEKVTLAFYNPANNARIQIFNAQGVMVARRGDLHGNSFTWKPAGLTQGRYLVKVTTGKKSVTRQVMYLK